MTTALLYDFMLVPGGAERVTLHALEQHPDWSLITACVDHSAFADDELPVQRMKSLTTLSGNPGWQAIKALRAFERARPSLTSFERVLFSGVYAPTAVEDRVSGGNYYYCHTPPRFAYDLADWYRQRTPAWQRPALSWLAVRVRDHFFNAMAKMDRIAANSYTVRERLKHHVGINQVKVIYPPVATAEWNWIDQEGFYLSTARLEPYKRVDLVIEAFKAMPKANLVITSGGSQEFALRKMAAGHDNIRFTGWCSDQELKHLTGRCRATIYLAKDEDFGMSPVESMAAGKPVIAAAEGGLKETVVHEETGFLIEPDQVKKPQSLIDAINLLGSKQALGMREACEMRAADFDSTVFDRALNIFLTEEQ